MPTREDDLYKAYADPHLVNARPCPFCGTTRLALAAGPCSSPIPRDAFRVLCSGCRSAGPMADLPGLAVERWNGNFRNRLRRWNAPG